MKLCLLKMCLLGVCISATGCLSLRPPTAQSTGGSAAGVTLEKYDIASTERCEALDNRSVLWAGVAAGAGVLAGSGGFTAISVDGKNLQTGLALSSLVMGAVAAGAAVLSQRSAATFALEGCAR